MGCSKVKFFLVAFLVVSVSAATLLWGAGNVSPFGFGAEQMGVKVVVDAESARYHGKDAYIPLVIWIGSWENITLNLDRTAFSLKDPSGNTHALATVEEIKDKKNYGDFKVADDYTFIQKTSDAGPIRSAFSGLALQGDTCFFINIAGRPGLLRDQVQVKPRAFTLALLYFANPGGKVAGTYVLTVKDAKGGFSVDVPFVIDWK